MTGFLSREAHKEQYLAAGPARSNLRYGYVAVG
jgi:hypothetical protein